MFARFCLARFSVLMLSVVAFGCAGQNAAKSPEGAAVEVDVTDAELASVVGDFSGSFGKLSIKNDRTYSASLVKGIAFRTGPKTAVTHEFYVNCTLKEGGRVEIISQGGTKQIRFKTEKADVVNAAAAEEGGQDFDAAEVCGLYANARKSKPLSVKYEVPSKGAVALQAWPLIEFGTYKGEPTHFLPLIKTPARIGMLFSRDDQAIDVTSFISPYLEQSAVPTGFRLAEGKWPAQGYEYDSKAGRLSFFSNSCAFTVEIKAVVTIRAGELTIFPGDSVEARDLDTEASRLYAPIREQGSSRECDSARAEFEVRKLKKRGISIRIPNWQRLELRSGRMVVQKQIPDTLGRAPSDVVQQEQSSAQQ